MKIELNSCELNLIVLALESQDKEVRKTFKTTDEILKDLKGKNCDSVSEEQIEFVESFKRIALSTLSENEKILIRLRDILEDVDY